MSGRVRYDKLVRDLIPDIIRARGDEPVCRLADEREYWMRLKDKLLEEFGEFCRDESIGEMADILEVIDAIIEFKGFDRREIDAVKSRKAAERGRFRGRVILEEA